jgi:hypothetical protein
MMTKDEANAMSQQNATQPAKQRSNQRMPMNNHPPVCPDRAPIPPDVRAAVLQRAEGRCEGCGRTKPLELHHTTYNLYEVTGYHRDIGGLVFGHETPDVLRALCRECHHHADMTSWGEFIGDIDEHNDQVEHWNHLWEHC